jgi:hypothetical protein
VPCIDGLVKGQKSNLINPYKRSNDFGGGGGALFKSIRKNRQLPKALIPLVLAFYFAQPRRKAGNFTFGSTRQINLYRHKGEEEERVAYKPQCAGPANKRQISVTRPRIVSCVFRM